MLWEKIDVFLNVSYGTCFSTVPVVVCDNDFINITTEYTAINYYLVTQFLV